ncbi:tetratricopeptide repeat protein [Pseudodesulfovibrio senegalensis]|uniref:Tetratricopeptide repeat protein n=1 Tax=Pseudodesulfovibrio senegalensis TaxID=1721087 RepID=A0A6N6N5D4_9BACT|nr:tetratricopeptide repeat protein [Pseudodesulfovibrio senegalensis]KAB1442988.1 tetratricopeptide repeat protein [Pseudodesulfovibrio senegalensis]
MNASRERRPEEPDFGCRGIDDDKESLRCVFSSTREITVGTGTTQKKHQTKVLWFVEQTGEDSYSIKKINPHFVPVGKPTTVSFDELMTDFAPEVELHMGKVGPAMRELHETLERGDSNREEGVLNKAEYEYGQALIVDEQNVRAIFGLGLVYADRKDRENAAAVFRQLVEMDAPFQEEHKHLFNEFGIALRKAELLDESVEYYSRALGFSEDDDDHLYYNLGRAHYERHDWQQCLDCMARALELNGGLEAALDLCELINALAEDDDLREKYRKPSIPPEVGTQVAALLQKHGREPKA